MAKHCHHWIMRNKGGLFVFCRTCDAQVRILVLDMPRHIGISVQVLAGRVNQVDREKLCDQVHGVIVDVQRSRRRRRAPARAA